MGDLSQKSWTRKILHVDMDAFFASIEQRDNPALRGKPVIVGGNLGGRGVVAAASYEARRFGVHSAMPTAQAYKKCPEGVFLHPRFEKYQEASVLIHSILTQYTGRVEPMGMDEAFLDVTQNKLNMDDPVLLASLIKQNIKALTQLKASAGVAPNKTLAKIASGINKPDGLTVVHPHEIEKFLENLPVRTIPGVGPVSERSLQALGIRTCGELAGWDQAALIQAFGKWGVGLLARARGIDDDPVVTGWEPKQIGSEETFEKDLLDLPALQNKLAFLAEDVAQRLHARGWRARTVTLKVTYADFTRITRSRTRTSPWDDVQTIQKDAIKLLQEKTEAGKRPIRLLGISISGFAAGQEELDLKFE